ncbi:hypothetical protein AB4Y42_10400 [Paraburkholderia sp. EG286B]|uniref:hypothetical protein n=1 Tax=Paraburkholderia sp. EG286B TaxID=3237011 RepID=UPI0034D1FD4C
MKFIERHPKLSTVALLIGSFIVLYPAFAHLADRGKLIDRNTEARIAAHCAETVEGIRGIDAQANVYQACFNSTWQTVERLLTSREYGEQWARESDGDGFSPGVSRYW